RITKMLPQDSSQIKLKWITKISKANEDELNQNVRSRSAILRVVEKL
ncbi:16S rRNA (cytosine(1402)-N(4))-methyltransferase, partial [Francisella tularensis subsp. holarctica]